ncbi:MAG: hypothetical protein GYA24_13210 [Candidatus Lokiarchaeota archaeon]|nr:hypothetical protein [Candidatus Lokiarchaeota archaeon]
MDRRKKLTLWTTALSLGGALLVLLLVPNLDPWTRIAIAFGFMIGGQCLRYWLNERYVRKKYGKRLTRKEMEKEVNEYFQAHVDIAARFVRMDELRRKGNYHDAIGIANALRKEELSPIVHQYLEYKLAQFKKMEKHGL